MTGIPPYLAVPLGCVLGLLGYGPVTRWIGVMRRARERDFQVPNAQRKASQMMLFMFATMHPAPWLLIVAVPFALYEVVFDPLRWMWLWVIAGAVLAVALLMLYDARKAGRADQDKSTQV